MTERSQAGIPRRIWRLLSPAERKRAAAAAVTVFAGVLLDFAGIASLLPVLYYLLDDGGNGRAVLLFSLLALAVIVLKCIAGTALNRYENHFLLGLYRRLSLSLFSSYYGRGLLYIRNRGIQKLCYEINSSCYSFSQGLLAPMLRIAGDGLLLLAVLTALLLYSPVMAAVLTAAFLPSIVVYILFIRKRVRDFGEKEWEAKRRQWSVTGDALGGYAEVEVNGASALFVKEFVRGLDEISGSRMRMNMLVRIPQFLSEFSAVAGLALMAMLSSGEVRVVVGVFAVAALRLLPAMRSVMTGWTQVRNASCCLDVLEEGLEENGDGPAGPVSGLLGLTFMNELRLKDVSFAYPDGEKVLSGFSLTVHKGEYAGIRGVSGVGKSTLFNLLLGFLAPDSGQVLVDGVPLGPDNRAAWQRKVGYVPQQVYIFNGTLADNIALGDSAPDRGRIRTLIETVGLDGWAQGLDRGVDTALGEQGGRLSGGQRQRIGIARALYREVEVLLLDEATSALDNDSEREVNEAVARLRQRRPGLTVISIAHRDSTLAYCDRIIEM